MSLVTVAGRRVGAAGEQRRRRRPDTAVALGVGRREAEPPDYRAEPVSPGVLRAHWRIAFDAAQAALRAGSLCLSTQELGEHATRLAAERGTTARLLQAFARDQRASAPFSHLLLPPREARRLIGLPRDVTGCVFNLDGVLIGSAAIHVQAWTETFDELISRRIERTGGRFAPFNPRVDYAVHMHGRPRLDGVRDFLASRGIRLPDGHPGDSAGAETVHGLANRKNAALLRLLDRRGLTAFAGAREYLETARDAGLHCAVVSASANTAAILERAGLAALIEGSVDGDAIVADNLRARPEPDILLAACRRVGLEPRHTAVFETSRGGIAAGRAAGCALVVGVARSGDAKALLDAGADLVVSGLEELLDRKLAA